jgi:hypothetical protein
MSEQRLDRQLQSIASAMVADPPDVPEWESLRGRTTPPAVAHRTVAGRRWSGPLVAVATTVLVLAAVGGVTLVTRLGRSPGGGTTSPPVTTTSATTVPVVTAPLFVGEFTQQNVPAGVSAGRDFVAGAARTGFGTVLVGYHLKTGPQEPWAWVAFSGSDWEPVDLAPLAQPGMTVYLQDVVATPDGAAILGVRYEADTPDARWNRVLYRSSDGRTWALDDQVTEAEAVALGFVRVAMPADETLHIVDTVRFGSQLLATGATLDGTPVLFVSSDGGATWGSADAGVFAVAEYGVAAIAAGESRLVAVGQRQLDDGSAGDGDVVPVFWFSDDGTAWRQVDGQEALAVTGDIPRAVVAAGSGFVAYGDAAGAEHRTVLWTSPDGLTWERRVLSELGDRVIQYIWADGDTVTLFAALPAIPDSDQLGAFEVWTAPITNS